MSIESDLVEFLVVVEGLSESSARQLAVDIAPKIANRRERERRSRAMRDLLPHCGANVVALRFGVCRATVYNNAKLSKKYPSELDNPGVESA